MQSSCKVAEARRAALLLLLLRKLRVLAFEVLLEHVAHNNAQPIGRYADRVRVRVAETPVLWPHVSGERGERSALKIRGIGMDGYSRSGDVAEL